MRPLIFLIVISLFVFPITGFASEVDQEIIDKKDDVVDAVTVTKRKQGFLAVPIPISDPTVGTGLGAVALYMHPQRGDDTVSKTATTGVFGMYTNTESWLVGIGHDDYWAEDRFRFTGALAYGEFNLKYYGVGDQPVLEENPLDYNFETLAFIPKFQVRLLDSNWYMGARYYYLDSDITFKTSNLHPGLPDISATTTTAGLGLVTSYDTRDSNYYPTKGIWFEIIGTNYGEHFGGDFEYNKVTSFISYYYSVLKNVVLAGTLDGKFSDGDVPFYDLPNLSMRGFSSGRYIDNNSLVGKFEARWNVYKRWGLIGFLEGGRVADEISNLGKSSTIVTSGFGVRFKAAKEQGLNVGVDVAFGPESTEIYIQIGEAF